MQHVTGFCRVGQSAVLASLVLIGGFQQLELSAFTQTVQRSSGRDLQSAGGVGDKKVATERKPDVPSDERVIGEWASGSGTLRLNDDGMIVQIEWYGSAEAQRRGLYVASDGILTVQWRERVYAGKKTALNRTERSTYTVSGSNLIITTFNDIVKRDVDVRWRRSR